MMPKLDLLCSGMFSDTLDKLGHRHQVVTGFIANNTPFRMMGFVRTLKLETIPTADERISIGLNFLGDLAAGEILLIEGSSEYAYFGEMMTRLSQRQHLGGVIIEGLTRDTVYTHDNCNLNIMARGYSPVDIKGRGRVDQTDCPIKIGGLAIRSGDFIFADSDALVVIPEQILNQVMATIDSVILEEQRIITLIDRDTPIPEILRSVTEF